MSTKKKASSVGLKSGRIDYKYIPRRVFGINDKKHVLFDGKLDGTIDYFPPRRHESGKFNLAITELELNWIEKSMELAPGTLNVNKRDNEFFEKMRVEMPKSGKILDLSDPYDYLVDAVLMSYDNIFAKGLKNKDARRSFRYVRIVEDEETNLILEVSDQRKMAYKTLGALEESRERMIMVLLNSGRRLSAKIADKELRRKVNELVEENYGKFNRDMEDPMFYIKGLLNMAVITGTVEVTRGLYYHEQEPLAFKDEPASFDNAVMFLADKANDKIKIAISKDTLNDFKRN